MNALRNLLLAATLCIPAAAFCQASVADDYVALLKSAAKAMDGDYRETWAFTETYSDSDTSTVGRYNPIEPEGERWTLITIDGREPTADEIEDYLVDKTNDQRSQEGDGGGNEEGQDGDVSETVRPDSLTLLEETDAYWLFNFVPSAEEDDDEDILEHLEGTLKIVKNGEYIEFLHMRATKPFKPRFGVKVKEFMTRLQFGPAADGGPVVPLSVEVSINVRAFLVANIKESNTTTFSDYEYVEE